MLPRSLERSINAVECNKDITLETVGDKDIKWTKIVSDLEGTAERTKCIKIDDINHVLGKVYDCVTAAKSRVPEKLRSTCRLSTNFADHLHRSFDSGLLAKPNTFSWDDLEAIV